MHWQQNIWSEILRDKLPTAKRIGEDAGDEE
jgi:ribonuclease D